MRRSPTLQARGQHSAKDFLFCAGERLDEPRLFALNVLRTRSQKCSGTCSRDLRKIEGTGYGYRLREQPAADTARPGQPGNIFTRTDKKRTTALTVELGDALHYPLLFVLS